LDIVKSKKRLRAELHSKRCALTLDQQRQASDSIVRQLYRLTPFLKARHVGLYWAFEGEVDLTSLTFDSLRNWYLPLISDAIRPWEKQRLMFQPWLSDSQTARNRFGIIEPQYDPRLMINPLMLDVVLMPVVGFDRAGNRLGMGKGYYDRTFSRWSNSWHKPLLLGIAHSIQECDGLDSRSWDIPIQAVITEKELIWFNSSMKINRV